MSLGGGSDSGSESNSYGENFAQSTGENWNATGSDSRNLSVNQSRSNQDVWGTQSPYLEGGYAAAADLGVNQLPQYQAAADKATGIQDAALQYMAPIMQQQADGGVYGVGGAGQDLMQANQGIMNTGMGQSQWGGQTAPGTMTQGLGQSDVSGQSQWGGQIDPGGQSQWGGQIDPGGQSQWGGQSNFGDVNSYTDAMKQSIASDAQQAQNQMLNSLDARAAASGMSGGSRHGVAIAQGMDDINRSMLSAQADIGFQADEAAQGRRMASEEAERSRLYGAGESELARSVASQEAERSRLYGAGESELARNVAAQEAERARLYGSGESGLDRSLSAQESALQRQYGAGESDLNRSLAAQEAERARLYGAGESQLARQMQGSQNLQNMYNTQEATTNNMVANTGNIMNLGMQGFNPLDAQWGAINNYMGAIGGPNNLTQSVSDALNMSATQQRGAGGGVNESTGYGYSDSGTLTDPGWDFNISNAGATKV